ncbi:MAG: hypothetical protein ABSF95_15065 [Verrucomicrobiota bacterium]
MRRKGERRPWERAQAGLLGAWRHCGLPLALWLLAWLGGAGALWAAPQFDVFIGYDGIVPEGSWFPVACEVKNDGPWFMGTVEVSPGSYSQGQVQRVPVELPTGTLKRLFIPLFSGNRGYGAWDVRLLDERGRVRAEQLGLQARRRIGSEAPLLGAMARTPAGVPTFRPIPSSSGQASDLQPISARLQQSIFPDNPLLLEGMRSIYLNSAQAAELKLNQVNALYAWLNAGGHLIIGLEQLSDINSTPWLKGLWPCELKDTRTVQPHAELQDWLTSPSGMAGGKLRTSMLAARAARSRSGPPRLEGSSAFSDVPLDVAFESADLLVATGTVLDGQVVVSSQNVPLVVTASRGRGRVTALLFSPEREPARSWKNLPTFWTKLTEVPAQWYGAQPAPAHYGGLSSDGIFGAMLDTRQVHKLPVEWLLLLLIVYLVVIGPLDQYWLKRIGKPMLTWITFPCYVVLFSLLIYFIGYKLRAGESEWNELHLVDVLLNGDRAELRGRTYASVYSPSNQRYRLESQQKYATLRGEFAGMWGGGQSGEKANVFQKGDSFKAEVFVPVWTSQLFVSDWWEPADVPLSVSVTAAGAGWKVTVANQTDHNLSNAQVVIEDRIFGLGDLAANQSKTFTLARERGALLTEFLAGQGARFTGAVQGRRQAFGSTQGGRIDDLPNASIAASFLSLAGYAPNLNLPNMNMYSRFISPPGLDVSPVVEHGGAMFFAWAGGYSPVKAINQFSPRRFNQNTLWRVAAALK